MDNLVAANIALDIFCIILSLIPIIYLLNVGRFQQKRNRYFMGISISNAFMIIGDLADWIIRDPTDPRMKMLLSFCSMIFYVSSAFVLYFFGRYMAEYLKLSKRARNIFLTVMTTLCGIQVFFAVISPFTGAIFYISDNGYQRGNLFMISQYVPLLSYLLFTFLMIWYRKRLTRRELIFFLLYIFIPLGAGATQMLFRGIAVVNVGVTLALLFIFVNIQSERDLLIKQQEKELGELHIDIMLSQIQPHFLYNTLTTLRQLCDIDPKLAKESIRNFSYFLRANMDSLTSKAPIPFEQELKHTENYLSLEQLRFQSRLHIIYEITVRDFSIPSLTLQPIVENAVRHGVLRREEGGTITIRTEETDELYQIIVSDDGVGFVSSQDKTDGHTHVGISNVQERLSAMCGGTLVIQSKTGMGTTAAITIPKENEHE